MKKFVFILSTLAIAFLVVFVIFGKQHAVKKDMISDSTAHFTGTLQTYLNSHCTSDKQGYPVISFKNLPLDFSNTSDSFAKPSDSATNNCISASLPEENAQDRFISIYQQDQPIYNIYDSLSQDIGHDGDSNLELNGTPIFNEGNIRINAQLVSYPGDKPVGRAYLILTGEKTFYTKDGARFFMNYSQDIASADNPELVTLLKPFVGSDNMLYDGDVFVASSPELEKQVIDRFLTNADTDAPEVTILNEMKTNLRAVQAK